MSNRPSVAVLLPVQNSAPYLEECLNSIAGQTYKVDRVYCIDDFSSDTSFDFLKHRLTLGLGPRLSVTKNLSKMGWPYCYNKAADLTRGRGADLLLIFNANNILKPTAISEMVACMETCDCDYVIGEGQTFGAGNASIYADTPTEAANYHSHSPFPNFCLIKSNVWFQMEGYDPDISEDDYPDWDLWIRLFKAGKKYAIVRQSLFLKRALNVDQVFETVDREKADLLVKKHFG